MLYAYVELLAVCRSKRLILSAAILDIAFTWKARQTMDDYHQILKYVLRLIIATIWIVVLPVYYVNTRRKYSCYSIRPGSVLGEWCYSSFMVVVAVYLMTNMVDMVLFFVPAVGRYIETSNYRICTALAWWTQVGYYRQYDSSPIY